jgi:hypothetical protein
VAPVLQLKTKESIGEFPSIKVVRLTVFPWQIKFDDEELIFSEFKHCAFDLSIRNVKNKINK